LPGRWVGCLSAGDLLLRGNYRLTVLSVHKYIQ
jgi:hypothetical protein